MAAMMTAKLTGIRKADGVGVRVLGCGGVIRRIVGRAVAHEFKAEIAEALGEHQHGVAKDGAA
eukprot:7465494-Alexandrium_andersonii.AAC.1